MQAQELLASGDLAGALAALKDTVRKDPSNAKHRVFLFQLLSVLGDWPRALTQLETAGELDAATLPMVQTYREVLQCEALRADIFAGKRAPLVMGDPEPWLALLLEALRLDAQGAHGQAADARAQAFEAAPASTGTIDGTPFAWIADADQRLGPVLEAVVNGRYYWIPFHRIAGIAVEPPADLRDTVWTPATFTWGNGGQAVGMIPTRYSGTTGAATAKAGGNGGNGSNGGGDSGDRGDSGLLLSRRTEWQESPPAGFGQRMLATDGADYALMDTRQIHIDQRQATDA